MFKQMGKLAPVKILKNDQLALIFFKIRTSMKLFRRYCWDIGAIWKMPFCACFLAYISIFPFPSVILSIRSRKNYGLLHVTLSKWHWSIGFPGDFELNSITFFLFLSHSNEGHFSINMTSTDSIEYTLRQTCSLSLEVCSKILSYLFFLSLLVLSDSFSILILLSESF